MAGLASAGVISLCSYASLQQYHAGKTCKSATAVSLLVAATLTYVMYQRYSSTGKVMPAGMVAGISGAMTGGETGRGVGSRASGFAASDHIIADSIFRGRKHGMMPRQSAASRGSPQMQCSCATSQPPAAEQRLVACCMYGHSAAAKHGAHMSMICGHHAQLL